MPGVQVKMRTSWDVALSNFRSAYIARLRPRWAIWTQPAPHALEKARSQRREVPVLIIIEAAGAGTDLLSGKVRAVVSPRILARP